MAFLLKRAISLSPIIPALHAATTTTRMASSASYPRGMVEIREYTLKPEGVGAYTKLATDYGDIRKQLLPLMGSVVHDDASRGHA